MSATIIEFKTRRIIGVEDAMRQAVVQDEDVKSLYDDFIRYEQGRGTIPVRSTNQIMADLSRLRMIGDEYEIQRNILMAELRAIGQKN